jgi:hypothetical protein
LKISNSTIFFAVVQNVQAQPNSVCEIVLILSLYQIFRKTTTRLADFLENFSHWRGVWHVFFQKTP